MERFLTEEDIEMFNAYAREYQEIAPYSNYLRDWWPQGNLELAQKLLKGRTILEKEISVELSGKLKERMYLEFLGKHEDFKQTLWYRIICKEDFILEQASLSTLHYALWDINNMYSNTIMDYFDIENSNTYTFVHKPTNKKMKITFKKTKLGKIFNFIVKQINDPELAAQYEAFRIDLSKLIQQKEFKGTLCLSVHPLDYATMSDNMENWTSCMSWNDNGCYRAGTLEMMASPIVLVGYIKSKTHTIEFGKYQWNSKIWRSLFIVNENIITEVKSYPFYNEAISKAAIEWIAELAGPKFSEAPLLESKEEDMDGDDHSLIFANSKKGIRLPTIYFATNRMYNDMALQRHYYAKASLDFILESNEFPFYTIEYGEIAPCLECGKEIELGGQLLCGDCGDYLKCSKCGEYLDPNGDNIFYGEDSTPYCEDCWEEITERCQWCEEYIETDRLETITYTKDEIKLTTEVCPYCIRSLLSRKIINDDYEVQTEYILADDFKYLFENALENIFTAKEEEKFLKSLTFEN